MTIKLKDYIKGNTKLSEDDILKGLKRIMFKGDNNMSITYGNKYTVRIKDYHSGAIITDSHNNKEILINELELLALSGKMHIMAVQNYGTPLDENSVDKAIDYVLDLMSKS